MPAPYNLTNITGQGNPAQLVTNINTLSGGLLGISMLFSFFFITWIGLTLFGNGSRDSFAASTFVTTLLSFLFWTQAWITDTIVIVMIGLTLVAITILRFRR